MALNRKERSVESIMIEVNRKLYMDESPGNKNAGFNSPLSWGSVKRLIMSVLNKLPHRLLTNRVSPVTAEKIGYEQYEDKGKLLVYGSIFDHKLILIEKKTANRYSKINRGVDIADINKYTQI